MKKLKIESSLEYGRIYNGIWTLFFYFSFVLGGLVAIGLVAIAIYENNMLYLLGEWFLILFCSILIWMIIKYRKINKKIDLWITDAVELNATCKCIDKDFGGTRTLYRIMVRFYYNDAPIIRKSGDCRNENVKSGFDRVFRKYLDKKIKILYSPKYDQVLILKQN